MEKVLALILGIALVIFLILKTKVQAFPALLIAAIVTGLIAQMAPGDVAKAVSDGFGSTLSSIGIIIGLGVMMGKILEVTGAAKKMAVVILKIVGEERAELVLALSGYLISIPVFCDSGFVILSELSREFSRETKKSLVALGCSLGIGLYITHYLVPPTPGPLGVAGLLGVDVGSLILWGSLLGLILVFVGVASSKFLASKCPTVVPESTAEARSFLADAASLPSGIMSFAPVLIPVVLILMKTVSDAMGVTNDIVMLIGNPIVAVLVGVLISIYGLARKEDRETVIKTLESSLADAGLILCITGAGGALGSVLRVSGIGDYIANGIAQSGFPAILLPMLMAALLKIAQGSGTVSVITTASILAPMIGGLGISPLLTTLAICTGGMIASFINDSYFWVVTRFSDMDVRTGIRAWTATSAITGFVGCVLVLILGLFL